MPSRTSTLKFGIILPPLCSLPVLLHTRGHLLFRLLGECLFFREFSSYAIDLLFEVFDLGGERCVLLQPLQEFALLR